MQIKEYFIERYGPLANTGHVTLAKFNLLFGNNEEGKSLSIDAIVKMLFNKKADLKKFEKLERVEESPEGYLVIEDDNSKEVKLPEAGDISKIANLSSLDCANLFIIRNSDLSIANEGEAYKNVTDGLTGLRTEEIFKLKQKLQEIGKLTKPESSSVLSNDQKYGKIAGRVKDAQTLIEDIQEKLAAFTEEGYEKIDEQLSQASEEIQEIDRKLGEMEYAEKRLKYEKASAAVEYFKKSLQKIKELAAFNRDDEQRWRDAERDLKADNEKKQGIIAELETKERELKTEKEKWKRLNKEFDSLQQKKKKIDDEVKLDLKTHEKSRQSLAALTTRDQYLKLPTYGASIFFALLALSLIFATIPVLIILTVVFAAVVLALWALKIFFAIKSSMIDSDFERIRLNVARFGFKVDSIEDIVTQIQGFEESFELKNKETNDQSNDVELREKEIKKLKDKELPAVEENIESSEQTIDGLKSESGVKSLGDYKKNLALKQQAEGSRDEQAATLKAFFGVVQKPDENMRRWQKEIEKLEEYRGKGKGIEYDETQVARLKSGKHELDSKRSELLSVMNTFKRQLYDIENSTNKILQPPGEGRLPCNTCVDLDAIKRKLESFISEQGQNAKKTQKVIGILEEVEREEEQKIQSLFGEGSLVSGYFSEITDNRYVEVDFLPEEGKIVVKLNDGKSQDASKLSGGAYDQLYLSIRLALGDKLLKGKKGFFIMDDPFIKADPSRLEKQMEILKKISSMGWQIIYFSAKGEVKDCLSPDIRGKDIKLIEIQNIRH